MTTLKSKFYGLFVLIISIYFLACATPKRIQKSDPALLRSQSDQTTEAYKNSEFTQLVESYQLGKFPVTIKKAIQIEKKVKHTQTALKALTLLIHSKALTQLNDCPQAIKTLKKATSINSPFKAFIHIDLANCYIKSSNFDESLQVLSEVRPHQIPEITSNLKFLDNDPYAYQKKYYRLRSIVFTEMGLPVESARELIALSYYYTNEENIELFNSLEKAIKPIENIGTLELLIKESDDSPIQDILIYKLVSNQIAQGLTEKAKNHFHILKKKFPNSKFIPLIPFSQSELASANTSNQVDQSVIGSSTYEVSATRSRTIGILLPLTGRYAKFGLRTLQSILIASQLFEKNSSTSLEIKIVVEDTGEDTIDAITALNRLYYEHEVIAVIGPILSKGIDQISKRATELKLPLISLAQISPIEESPYFFSAGVTASVQSLNLAKFIVENLKITKMAVIYPQSKFGETMAYEFWDQFESVGGQITSVQSYSPFETDFRRPIEKMSGLYFQDTRRSEWEALLQERTEKGITKRSRKTENFFNLKPIADFDGVFIADSGKTASQIIPTFNYRDIDSVKFFGPSSWNTDEFLSRLPKNMKYEIYLSDFETLSGATTTQTESVKTLSAQYRTLTDQELTGTEINAFETFYYLAQSFQSQSFTSRENLKEILTSNGINSSSKSSTFSQVRVQGTQFIKTLPILKLQNGHFHLNQ